MTQGIAINMTTTAINVLIESTMFCLLINSSHTFLQDFASPYNSQNIQPAHMVNKAVASNALNYRYPSVVHKTFSSTQCTVHYSYQFLLQLARYSTAHQFHYLALWWMHQLLYISTEYSILTDDVVEGSSKREIGNNW